HALAWNSATGQFSCQSITGSGAAGLLNSTNTWTAQQTFNNQITVSSNVVISGALVANSSAGVSGQFLTSQGPGTTPVWGNIAASAISGNNLPGGSTSYIQNSSTLQSGATAYPSYMYAGSSASVLGPFQVNGQITAGTGNNVITTAAG